MKISLHLGAHKTASTYLQNALAASAADLAGRGILCPGLEETRRSLTRRLSNGVRDAEKARAKIARAQGFVDALIERPGARRLVLSDENLIGTPRLVVMEGRLYTDLENRLGPMAAILKGHEVEIFLAIRDLGDFSRSIYCEYLKGETKTFVAPEAFRTRWRKTGHSWLEIVSRIRALFPEARMTVWDYAMVKQNAQLILNRIAGLDGKQQFDLQGVPRRRSLSHDATEALVAIAEREGIDAMRARVAEISRAHRLRPGNRQYRMWDAASEARYRAAFKKDLEAIAGLQPEVELLG